MAVTSGKQSAAGIKSAVAPKASGVAPAAASAKAAPVKAQAVKTEPVKAAPVTATPVKAEASKPTAAKPSAPKVAPAAEPVQAKPLETKALAEKIVAKSPAPAAVPPAPIVKTVPAKAAAAKPSNPSTFIRVEHAMQVTKEQIEKASSTFFKGYEDLASLGKGNVEAVVKSGTIVARGFEEMGRHLMALAQANMEHSVATAKAAMNCTTLKQIVELQNDFAKSAFDKAMAEGNKLSELSVKVANEAIEPIQARVDVTVKTLVKPIAA
jgi:phasin family protein